MWKGYLSGLVDWSKPCPEECSVADDEGNWSKGEVRGGVSIQYEKKLKINFSAN